MFPAIFNVVCMTNKAFPDLEHLISKLNGPSITVSTNTSSPCLPPRPWYCQRGSDHPLGAAAKASHHSYRATAPVRGSFASKMYSTIC